MQVLMTIIALVLTVALSVSENKKTTMALENSIAQQVNFGGNYR